MARKQTVKQKPATRNKSVKRPGKRPVKKAVKKASLGRPRIAGTAELDMESVSYTHLTLPTKA